MNLPVIAAFVLASLAILLIPGPSVVYVATRSFEYGRAAGLWSVLGIETGAALHALAAALGLAVLLDSSPTAYTVIKCTGAAYLVWLAIREFSRRGDAVGPLRQQRRPGPLKLYLDGVLVDLLNPKTILFFVAFLPQFVDPDRGAATQFGLMGLAFVGLALLCDGGYALAAGSLSRRLKASARSRRGLSHATGGVYLALAGVAVVS
ncbi:MAG TPA: LysE family translocator [Microlunatus sp.]